MKQILHALSDMRVVVLRGDRDAAQVSARRALIARLCCAIEGSRRGGGGPSQRRRLFGRDEAIALGALFVLAMREVGMQDVIARSEELAAGLHERLVHEPANAPELDDTTEDDLIEAAEQLSNGIVTQLERATGELW